MSNPRVIFNDNRLENYVFNKLATPPNISHTGSLLMLDPLEMNNYYPFGMLKEGMFAKSGDGYRYGFNGMERDNVTKGFGNDLSTFFRGYDPRLARWKSKDPITNAMESAYVGFSNNPVLFVDPWGNATYINLSTNEKQEFDYDGPFWYTVGVVWQKFEVTVWASREPVPLEDRTILQGLSEGGRDRLNDELTRAWEYYSDFSLLLDDVVAEAESYVDALGMIASIVGGDEETIARVENAINRIAEKAPNLTKYEIAYKVSYNLPEIIQTFLTAGAGAVKNGTSITKESLKGVSNELANTIVETVASEIVDYEGRIINKKLSNGEHGTTSVPYDSFGFPDFSNYLYPDGPNEVTITPTGDRNKDRDAANAEANYDFTPKGYIWHHHRLYGKMQLVQEYEHAKSGHTSGWAIWGKPEIINKNKKED